MKAAAKIQLCESTSTALGHSHSTAWRDLLSRNLVLLPSSAYCSSGQKHLLEVVPDPLSPTHDRSQDPWLSSPSHPQQRSQAAVPGPRRPWAGERHRSRGLAPGTRSGTDALAAADSQPLPLASPSHPQHIVWHGCHTPSSPDRMPAPSPSPVRDSCTGLC